MGKNQQGKGGDINVWTHNILRITFTCNPIWFCVSVYYNSTSHYLCCDNEVKGGD